MGDIPKGLASSGISLSNATLLSIVFLVCGVHKLNYIKNDFI